MSKMKNSYMYNQRHAVKDYLAANIDKKFYKAREKELDKAIKEGNFNSYANSVLNINEFGNYNVNKLKYQYYLADCALLLNTIKKAAEAPDKDTAHNYFRAIAVVTNCIAQANIGAINLEKNKLTAADKKVLQHIQNLAVNDMVKLKKYSKEIKKEADEVGDIYALSPEMSEVKRNKCEKFEGYNLSTVDYKLSGKLMTDKLNATNSIWHINSSEYKRMENSIKTFQQKTDALEDYENADEDTRKEIHKCIKEMEAAVEGYINAKGLGSKSTDLGKERLALALEIDSYAKSLKAGILEQECHNEKICEELVEKYKENDTFDITECLANSNDKADGSYERDDDLTSEFDYMDIK